MIVCRCHSLEWQSPGRTQSPVVRNVHGYAPFVIPRAVAGSRTPQLGEDPGPGFCVSGYASAQNDERRDARDDELRERGVRRRGYPQIRWVGFRRAGEPRYRVEMVRRRAAGAIGAIAALALLAGCGVQSQAPEPTSLPTQSVAPEPSTEPAGTPEPTPFPTDQLPERLSDLVTEPVLPVEAREFTTDGAAAFAQYVIDATNWAYATGDAAPLLDHCSEDSAYCQSVMAHAPEFEGAERTRFGGLMTLTVDSVELYADDAVAFVIGTASVGEATDLDTEGFKSGEVDQRDLDVTLQMQFTAGIWTLLLAGGT